MSHFNCEKCGTLLIDTDRGYITGCEHYPADILPDSRDPMPNTVAAWQRLYGLAEKVMLEDKTTIAKLKTKINQLEQGMKYNGRS